MLSPPVVPAIVSLPFVPVNGVEQRLGSRAIWLVAADSVVWLPLEFVAVLRKRSVCPTSGPPDVYVVPVAPPIGEQLLPAASQRSHWNVGLIGCPPGLPVSREFARATPEIVGVGHAA